MLKKVEGKVNFHIPNGVWVALEALFRLVYRGMSLEKDIVSKD